MHRFDGSGDSCPICGLALVAAVDRSDHWLGHTFQVATGHGAGGYTWICTCGPSALYWEEHQAAVAGLAIHMLDLHQIAVASQRSVSTGGQHSRIEEPTMTDPVPDPLTAGQQARCAAATALRPSEAEAALRGLLPLERVEYLKKSAGLTRSQRLQLWTLRAALRGLDATAALAEPSGIGPTLHAYWTWVIETGNPTVSACSARPVNRIPGNLAAAIAQEPGQRAYVLACWQGFAGLLGLPAGTAQPSLDNMAGTLGRCRPTDLDGPTVRALELGLEIAVLTGLPPALVLAHRDSWERERDVLLATNEALDERARHASARDYADGPSAEVPRNYAPRTAVLPDGRQRLVLAAPELAILNDELTGRVLVRLLRSLRQAEFPRPGTAFGVAYSAYLDRRHGHRDDDGVPVRSGRADVDPESLTVRPPPPQPGDGRCAESDPPGPSYDEAELAAAERFTVAQDWLCGAVELRMRALERELASAGAARVFPTALYGARRAGQLDLVHLYAARNCLQFVCSAAYLDRATQQPRLPAEDDPKAEFTRHMRGTAPGRWNATDAARHATGGFVGAVGYAAWQASSALAFDDAPWFAVDAARDLVLRIRQYAGLAALAGLVSTLRRLAPPGGRRIASWFRSVQAGTAVIVELTGELAGLPGLAEHPGLAGAAQSVRQLGAEYAEAAGRDNVPELATWARELTAAADALDRDRAA